MKKILTDRKDLYLALLEYRNTPISTRVPSPATLLFKRRLQTQIPMQDILLQPEIVSNNLVKELESRNIKQKLYIL